MKKNLYNFIDPSVYHTYAHKSQINTDAPGIPILTVSKDVKVYLFALLKNLILSIINGIPHDGITTHTQFITYRLHKNME